MSTTTQGGVAPPSASASSDAEVLDFGSLSTDEAQAVVRRLDTHHSSSTIVGESVLLLPQVVTPVTTGQVTAAEFAVKMGTNADYVGVWVRVAEIIRHYTSDEAGREIKSSTALRLLDHAFRNRQVLGLDGITRHFQNSGENGAGTWKGIVKGDKGLLDRIDKSGNAARKVRNAREGAKERVPATHATQVANVAVNFGKWRQEWELSGSYTGDDLLKALVEAEERLSEWLAQFREVKNGRESA